MKTRPRRELSDFEWRMERDHAQRAPCPRCEAAISEPCRNPITGEELRAPAHFQRIDAANQLETP